MKENMSLDNVNNELKKCVALKNQEYAETLMCFLEKNSILSERDLQNLQDRSYCRDKFKSDYAMLLKLGSRDEKAVKNR